MKVKKNSKVDSVKRTGRANSQNPVVLVVLDGWGIAPRGPHNAISLAKTPNFDSLKQEFGCIEICASGACVGLTDGQMGNSEVGHLTIGSGRIVFQDLMRVNEEISTGKLAKNTTLLSALRSAKRKGNSVHFLGLLSDGGVHSHIRHLFALLGIAKDNGVSSVFIHVFLDGRDTPPRSGVNYLEALQSEIDSLALGKIATISGRYYAMDRDARWDRVKLAYDAIAYGKALHFDDPISSLKSLYDKGETDEFIPPLAAVGYEGIRDDDVLIFYNFRPDRARQLTKALSLNSKEFGELFDRDESRRPKAIQMITMTNYDPKLLAAKPLLSRERVRNTLSNILEKNGIRQLRLAETEKYAHVTYFFNGLVERPRRLEDRILIPSLKIGTYDKSPEMSAKEICENAIRAIASRKYGFILINFANADMVGHSGNVAATVKAVETVDSCLGEITRAWRETGEKGALLVTADHGNAEKLFDEHTGQPHTAHTSNPVPFIAISRKWKAANVEGGKGGLTDVAPSVLRIMGIMKPKSMTGKLLVAAKEPN